MLDSSSPSDDASEYQPPRSTSGWLIIAFLLSVAGLLLTLILTLVFSTVGDISRIAGGHLSPQRGLFGLLAVALGIVGTVYLTNRPRLAALLLLVACVLIFIAFHLFGLLAAPFLLLAALLNVITQTPSDASPDPELTLDA